MVTSTVLSLIKTILYIVLALTLFFFILANVSLMKNGKDKHIPTPHDVGKLPAYIPQNSDNVEEDINKYGQMIARKNNKECDDIKQHIIKMKIPDKTNQKQDTSSEKYSSVDNVLPSAPVLENFEDYAPVDIPKRVKKDKNLLSVRKCPEKKIVANNEPDTYTHAKFESEYRVPWSGKKGKDDLSYFFDTHKMDKSFDEIQRKEVVCPSQWEEDTRVHNQN